MSTYNWICEKSMSVGDALLGSSMANDFKFLMKSQWWSRKEIDEYQNVKLRIMIEHAYANVPYYRKLFLDNGLKPADITSTDDLKKIPLLTKEDIRQNFPKQIVATNISRKYMLLGGSSGSTGQPLQFYRTKKAQSLSRAANLRGWYWTGFRLGDPYIKIATMPRNSIQKKVQDWLNKSHYIHSRSMDNEDIRDIILMIKKSGVGVIRGYPGSLFILATHLEKTNDHSVHLQKIITTSEPLHAYLRKKIEMMFHCPIYDSYAAEGAPVIFECPTHNCYHIAHEMAIVEFIFSKNIGTSNNKSMVVTDLTNYATPFIRYDIKDVAVPYDQDCSCGRSMYSISSIEGRDTDILITTSGRYITFYYFAGYFEHKPYVDLFQLVQNDASHFTLYLVPNKNFHTSYVAEIKSDIITVLGVGNELAIEIVSDIPLTASGKRRFLVRDNSVPIGL